jgi:hypothetical protein
MKPGARTLPGIWRPVLISVRESDFRQRVRSPIDPASGYVASKAQLHLFAAKTGGAFPVSLARATAAC